MLFTTLLLLFLSLLSPALALALPQTTGNGATSPIGNINSTTITFYQGITSTSSSNSTLSNTNNNSTCGATAVLTSDLAASYCITFHTYSAAIAAIPDVDCVFALYKGSAKCAGDPNDGVQVTYVPVPRGNGTACVVSGVLDGGASEWTLSLIHI